MWTVFVSTFVAIFLAELGDKTQLAVLAASARGQNGWAVFFGACTALVASTALAFLAGSWLSNKLDPKLVHRAAGALFVILGIWMIVRG